MKQLILTVFLFFFLAATALAAAININTADKKALETLPGIGSRIGVAVYQTWYSTSNPTTTQKEQYTIAKADYEQLKINVLAIKNKLIVIEEKLNVKGIPYTPNRENFREE